MSITIGQATLTGNPNFRPQTTILGVPNGPVQVFSSSPKKLSEGNYITIKGRGFNSLKNASFLYLREIENPKFTNSISGLFELKNDNTKIVNDGELIFEADYASFNGTRERNFYVGFWYMVGNTFYYTNTSNDATLLVDI